MEGSSKSILKIGSLCKPNKNLYFFKVPNEQNFRSIISVLVNRDSCLFYLGYIHLEQKHGFSVNKFLFKNMIVYSFFKNKNPIDEDFTKL